jgi:hypothetical protein
MADSLRHTADLMDTVGVEQRYIKRVLDGADECDRVAFRLINLTTEAAA